MEGGWIGRRGVRCVRMCLVLRGWFGKADGFESRVESKTNHHQQHCADQSIPFEVSINVGRSSLLIQHTLRRALALACLYSDRPNAVVRARRFDEHRGGRVSSNDRSVSSSACPFPSCVDRLSIRSCDVTSSAAARRCLALKGHPLADSPFRRRLLNRASELPRLSHVEVRGGKRSQAFQQQERR